MRRVLIALVAVLLGAAALFIGSRGAGISALGREPMLERPLAVSVWRHLVPADIRARENPVPDTEEALKDAREHWADHCALCHGNDGAGDTTMGRRVYPRVPDMRSAAGQHLTDGELFYAIEQGIPWTAMPGWGNGSSEGARQSWALVRFIRHLPHLTPEEVKEMERLNPRPPPNATREREIDDFLQGAGR